MKESLSCQILYILLWNFRSFCVMTHDIAVVPLFKQQVNQ